MDVVTKSIGTSSRDYSTITAWEAALDDTGVYASGDDAVGECYDDSVFDESVTINGGGTVGLDSVHLTVAEGERHDGTAGTGVRIVREASVSGLVRLSVERSRVSWLEVDKNGFMSIGAQIMVHANVPTAHVDHCLVHDGGSTNSTMYGVGRSHNILGGANHIHNNVVYNITSTTRGSSLNGLSLGGVSRAANAHNNTVHRIVGDHDSQTQTSFDFGSNSSIAVRNNISTEAIITGGGTAVCFASSSSTVRSHNASSDATASGTGSLTNLDPADQYISTVVGSEDLRVKAGADIIGAGTDLSSTGIPDIEIDAAGNVRSGAWSIGAFELVVPENVTPPTLSGLEVAGQILTAHLGTWGPPLVDGEYSIAWQKRINEGEPEAIVGETTTELLLGVDLVLHQVRVGVTPDGGEVAWSEWTDPVAMPVSLTYESLSAMPTLSGDFTAIPVLDGALSAMPTLSGDIRNGP